MKPPIRILILTPSALPKLTGNAMTAERWRRSLRSKGQEAEVLSSDGLDQNIFLEFLSSFRPDLIHVHHAFKTAAVLLHPQSKTKIASLPLVVSPGGTDINLDLGINQRREAVLTILRMARVILTQNEETARSIIDQVPDLTDRIVRVPKACCWFGHEDFELRKIAGCVPDDILFFMPAGIRPVKGNLECLAAIEKLYTTRPAIRFVAAGPAIDPEYTERFEREVKRLSAFARWIHGIPPACMRSAYGASDIVLNASFSEGLPNSLLEAVAAGKAVLASNIPGNRHTVLGIEGDPRAGILFDPHDPSDFVRQATKLIDDPLLRERFGAANGLRKNRIPSPEEEADGLIAAYRIAAER